MQVHYQDPENVINRNIGELCLNLTCNSSSGRCNNGSYPGYSSRICNNQNKEVMLTLFTILTVLINQRNMKCIKSININCNNQSTFTI